MLKRLLIAFLCAGCAHPALTPPDDLSFRSIRVVEARAHPIYAEWTKAPPITQLLEIDFASAADFVGFASITDLPHVRFDAYRCDAQGQAQLPLTPFGGHVFWDNLAVEGILSDAPETAELRGHRERGPPYFYRSFLEIAARDDRTADPPRLAYDLLKTPSALCLQVSFTDLKTTPRRTNILFVPQDALSAAFLAGDLKPGTDYPGPKLP